MSRNLRRTRQMLAEARAEVAQADQKASIVLAALGIGFGTVLGGQLAGTFSSLSLSLPSQIIWWVGAILAALSVAASAFAVWPRYTTMDVSRGVTFWAHVATFKTLAELSTALRNQDVSDKDRAEHQLWRLSKLVRRKYSLIRVALMSAAISGLLLALASLVIR